MYYLGIIGVYAVGFPMVVWLMYLFHSLFYQNMTTLFFSWVISLTLFQLFTLGIQIGFKLARFDGQFFVVNFLGPTLLLNICYFFLFMWPLKSLFRLKLPYF
jgi:rod shape-determining protein MreD